MREATEADTGKEVVVSNTGDGDWVPAFLDRIIGADRDGKRYLAQVDAKWGVYRYASVPIQPSYLELHQASGLKVGDWVRITRAAKDGEQGWNAVWSPHMDQYVGSFAQISLDFGDANCGFKIDGAGEWSYPAFILEKVTHRPATEADMHKEVQWISDTDGKYWLVSIFQPKGCSHLRAVLEPMPGGGCKYTSYQFAFLNDVEIELQTAHQPPAEPDPAPEPVAEPEPQPIPEPGPERPAWLPEGWRQLGPEEVIQSNDRVQSNFYPDIPRSNDPYNMNSWASVASNPYVRDNAGKMVKDSKFPNDIWIRKIELPSWLPEEFKEVPSWLPAGYRFMALHEVIKPGDKWQDENNQDLFHNAVESIGGTVEDSWYPHRYWITPIREGQANG